MEVVFPAGDLVVEPERRHEGMDQMYRVVSIQEKKANEWRKDWYWPSVLHGLTLPQAKLFASAPDLAKEIDALRSELQDAVFAATSGHPQACKCSWCARLKDFLDASEGGHPG